MEKKNINNNLSEKKDMGTMTNTKRSRNTLSKSPWRWSKALDDSASPKDILSRGKTLVFRLAKKPWSNPLEKTYCLEIAVEIVWLSRKFFGFLNVLEEVCSIFTTVLRLVSVGRVPRIWTSSSETILMKALFLEDITSLAFLKLASATAPEAPGMFPTKKKKIMRISGK